MKKNHELLRLTVNLLSLFLGVHEDQNKLQFLAEIQTTIYYSLFSVKIKLSLVTQNHRPQKGRPSDRLTIVLPSSLAKAQGEEMSHKVCLIIIIDT